MGAMMRRAPILSTVAVFALGCASNTVAYPGPRRAANEVAVLVAHDTAIDAMDGQALELHVARKGARYEVLPGRHKLAVSLFVVRTSKDVNDVERSSGAADLCFDFLAGRTYVIGREGAGFAWRPIVVDEAREILPAPRCD
jgi:hypothetical protein